MQFGICPHDTSRNMNVWVTLNAYLRKKLPDFNAAIVECMDFTCFYEQAFQTMDVAYVNPMDAYTLQQERGFLPVCGTELYDEVVFVASLNVTASDLTAFASQPVACVDRQFATYLGFYLLRERGIAAGPPRWYGSWLKVVSVLMKGENHYGFLYKDFYDQLSGLARKQIQVVESSSARIATHILMVSPELSGLIAPLRDVLSAMHEDSEGKALLDEVRLGRWHPLDNLKDIQRVVESATALA